jgi:UTP-glucose-1-phosphate uridylyltransferase
MSNINPEGSYDEVNEMKEKDGDMYEKPEKMDMMGNINCNGKYILTKDNRHQPRGQVRRREDGGEASPQEA